MYFILALFFASLIGICYMVGRKLLLIRNGYVFPEEARISIEEEWEEWKRKVGRNIRLFGFVILVWLVRLYVKISHFVRIVSEEAAGKIKATYAKRSARGADEAKEASTFLRKVGEYKRRLKRIKQKVEEEKL